jgi:uncharacterized protein YcfJ
MKFKDVVEKSKEVANETKVIVVKEVQENDGLVGGVTGAVIGTVLIPIPVVGTALGGWIGYKLDKRMR